MKNAQFSPKPTVIVEATTVLWLLKTQEIYTEVSRSLNSDTDYRLLYLITVLFATNILFYIAV